MSHLTQDASRVPLQARSSPAAPSRTADTESATLQLPQTKAQCQRDGLSPSSLSVTPVTPGHLGQVPRVPDPYVTRRRESQAALSPCCSVAEVPAFSQLGNGINAPEDTLSGLHLNSSSPSQHYWHPEPDSSFSRGRGWVSPVHKIFSSTPDHHLPDAGSNHPPPMSRQQKNIRCWHRSSGGGTITPR